MLIGPIGSRQSFTTFYKDKHKHIMVSCGCFTGTLDEFAVQVDNTHGDNQHGKSYKAIIDMIRISMEDNKNVDL